MPPVEIQWSDHSIVLLEYLRQLYDDGRFVDVGLECEGRQVKAHKAVISACSPYLEGLLKGNPARSHLIKFNGYSYNSLRAVIDFMYNGKVVVEQEHLAAFLKLGRALQVRGILNIAAQCEEAGLTTPEETKSNAQYSSSVQQSQKQQQATPSSTASKQGSAETKKYAFMLDKQPIAKKPQTPQQTQPIVRKPPVSAVSEAAKQHQQLQQQQLQQQEQLQQEQVQQQPQLQAAEGSEVDASTIEELQQALASGQALLQTDGSGGEALQMVEGQCVVTGSGQTYVVVQEGDNISFVPAEMVQGDLQAAVNGGQVMEGLDTVEQQLAHMEGQVMAEGQEAEEGAGGDMAQSAEAGGEDQLVTSSEQTSGDAVQGVDAGTLEKMSVVESLVKLGQKQDDAHSAETTAGQMIQSPSRSEMDDFMASGIIDEAGADMPSLDTELGKDPPVESDDGAADDGDDSGPSASGDSPKRKASDWPAQGGVKKHKL